MDYFSILNGVYFLLVPGFGLIFHTFIQYYFWKRRKQLTAFYFICAIKSLAGWVVCFIFIIWAVPVCFLGKVFIWNSSILEKILHATLHIAISYLHLTQFTATVNRLIAVFSYTLYQKIFTIRNMKIYAWTVLFPSSWMLIYYFWDMNPYFDDYYLTWEVTSSLRVSPTDLESYLIWVLMASSCIIDFAALLKIVYDTQINKSISGIEAQRRMALNKKILIQTIMEEMMFVLDNIVYQCFGTNPQSRLELFFGSTLTWCLSYTLEGLVIILFTQEMRQRFFRQQRKLTIITIDGRSRISHNAWAASKSPSKIGT